ncbi:efflux RND transporter periplasmic adaptor subunit [Devosia limi]|uniref:Membrane fusion protein, multidrug efflux system n=1 Tax=Devosia limi DSM 17137 TaxID=1121477 RepID=A0A1M4SY46_9HYPH|nr:efflux RND transporter periplasmic adaptor subunit [Devosia limi]SHE37148.1 membrane fusion protein, multidrug efflux system [Devosia limi DSM 17137]
MRALFSYGVALVILVVAGAWFATGSLVIGGNGPGNGEKPLIAVIEGKEHGPIATTMENAGVMAQHETTHAVDPHLTIAQRNAAGADAATKAQSVRTSTYVAKPMPIEVQLRGRTQAKASVGAVAETPGIVDTVHVTKGQKVAIGDLLCTLDQGTRAAAVAQAEAGIAQANASLDQAQADYDTNAELRDKGLAAPNTARSVEVALTVAKAGVTTAQAALDNAQAELDRTEIHAKVAGVVQDPLVTAGAMLAQGQPCATIVQLDPMIFIGQVPEARIQLAKLGLEAKISTITGQESAGKVTFISSTADAATRSFPIEIELPNPDGSIRDGMTATATVNMGAAPAHLVPQSVLTLNDDGVLGVSTVVDGAVKFLPVTIASDTREGVWVLGLPLSVDVITVGQEYVVDGQTVAATNVTVS